MEFDKEKDFSYNLRFFTHVIINKVELEVMQKIEILEFLKKYSDMDMLADDLLRYFEESFHK